MDRYKRIFFEYLSKEISGKLPEGDYWFGDPCYVMKEDVYHNQWGLKDFEDGIYNFEGGHFAVARTFYGDGSYSGTNGKIYHVDAGCLCLMSTNLIDPEKHSKISSGTLVKGPVDFNFSNGVFIVESLNEKFTVDTEGSDEEDEDEEEYNDEPEYDEE
jgi:hypothetical protein